MEKWFNVGKIVNTHGVRGEVRVISRTDFADERYEVGNTLYVEKTSGEKIKLTVAAHRKHKQFDLLQFEGYHNINDVEPLKGSILQVPEDQLGELEENEFYYHEIIGCQVVTEDGQEVGKVKEILSPGANDVWVVQRHGQKDLLLPYIDNVILDVNIEEQVVTVHIMEGLD